MRTVDRPLHGRLEGSSELFSSMVFRASLTFTACDADVGAFVTKFGGQPTWLGAPEWPVSRRFGTPMRFIGQLRLSDAGHRSSAMAYLFMTDTVTAGHRVPQNRLMDGGENALVLQPGRNARLRTVPFETGPTAVTAQHRFGRSYPTAEHSVWRAELTPQSDPEFISEARYQRLGPADWQKYGAAIVGAKMGGTPNFRQGDAFPYGDPTWQLLLQLPALSTPFWLDFGYDGQGYAFVNRQLTSGRFCWQDGAG
ncbi:DUF1963 domain-containing protein [Subtercola sp. YIM 133946]|uniref:DUF1963 domain-containing protein n=1 Tax=Subtercola sp. YIM 133946 TaxID=3118909 RepID=UPI002F933737